ncbi:MAG: 50S ribosomal protein L24 [Parvularculaceae bacterium]|nr:50S ribosomal protein L24 [Parvularculaceae bacterium]
MAAKIKKGDKVVVLAGKHRGEQAEVLKVFPKDDRVLVKGVNVVAKHEKQTATSRGGILREEAPIHISNVALLGKDGKPTRVGFKIDEKGKKARIERRTGEVVNG